MACHAMHLWTFSGLVGAYLDLAIAYFLLCASTVAYIASKFLGFFGLRLPCPCNGLFGIPNETLCLQRLLVDCPAERVSSVQFSAKSKFPFDSIMANDPDCHMNMKLITDVNHVNEFLEIEEASCSSASDARKPQNITRRDSEPRNDNCDAFGVKNFPRVKEGRLDIKGKGIMNQRSKCGIRRRGKGGLNHGKSSSASSYDLPFVDVLHVPQSSSSISKEENLIGDCSLPADSNSIYDDRDAPVLLRLGERALQDFELNEPLGKNRAIEKKMSSVEGLIVDVLREWGHDSDVKNAIRVLEQSLEEEQAARAALYLELEKERHAAATAADEAMAMILRLQEEKASIEMEARQYQRIIEEKSSYDAEEMNILKEILVRREREKHFLEKEVEAYTQMLYPGNEHLEDEIKDMVDMQGEQPASSFDASEDPVLMLHQLSESIDKKKMVKKSSDNEATSTNNQNYIVAFGGDFPVQGWDKDVDLLKRGDLSELFSHIPIGIPGNDGLQEKEIVSMDNISHDQPSGGQKLGRIMQSYTSNSSQDQNLLERTAPLVGEEQEENDNAYLHEAVSIKTPDTHIETENYIAQDGENLEKHEKDAYQESKSTCLISEREVCVHDVHVIDDESRLGTDVTGKKGDLPSAKNISNIHGANEHPSGASVMQKLHVRRGHTSARQLDSEPEIDESSKAISGLPPIGPRRKSVVPDPRRNSMSALDIERLKIDSEVGWLRERLRTVQEGREKLNLSSEHWERDRKQLQLLEDIACQLREIRQLTEPGKAMRQASLPPPTSKVVSKKRRRRSASLGIQRSF